MQNSLRSRKKLNAEIMYDMRRQGMSNKQIAENLHIGIHRLWPHRQEVDGCQARLGAKQSDRCGCACCEYRCNQRRKRF